MRLEGVDLLGGADEEAGVVGRRESSPLALGSAQLLLGGRHDLRGCLLLLVAGAVLFLVLPFNQLSDADVGDGLDDVGQHDVLAQEDVLHNAIWTDPQR